MKSINSNIKNIYFIDRPTFNRDFYDKYEFENLTNIGYNVHFLNLTSFLKGKQYEVYIPKEISEYVLNFKSKSEFRNFIKSHKDVSIIFSLVPFKPLTAWFYLFIFRYSVKYIVFNNLTIFPNLMGNIKKPRKSKIIRSYKRFGIVRTLRKVYNEVIYYMAKIQKRDAAICIHSKQEDNWKNKTLVGNSTFDIYSYGADYKLAFEKDNENIVGEKYAVFIDQYFFHHNDFKSHHIIHFFTAKEYYTLLNKYLIDFAINTGLKVVIASHPRRCNEKLNDFDSHFDLYFNKTAQLVKYSELVLLHFSTAISFAVIFNKPFLLLNSKLFKNGTIEENISGFEFYFGVNSIYMEDPFSISSDKEQNLINKDAYSKYINAFLKHPKADNFKTFTQIVNDIISFTK